METMNTETSMKTISGRISEYAAAFSFRGVPESVVAYAKMLSWACSARFCPASIRPRAS